MLNGDLVKALNMPETKQRAAELGVDLISSTPEEFSAFIKTETAKWAKVVKNAGLEPK